MPLTLSPQHDRLIRTGLLAGLAVLLAGLVVPVPLRALIEAAILGGALLATLAGLSRDDGFRTLRMAFLGFTALYLILLLNPNLPGLKAGLEGLRYTLVTLAGLTLGLTLPDRQSGLRLLPGITALLLAAATASLVAHLFFPGFETSLYRSADAATGVLGGQIRMQGLLSGPFHVAMLGCFLTLSGAWLLLRRCLAGLPLLMVGETVLMLARVRTGLIAGVLGLLLLGLLWLYQRRAGAAVPAAGHEFARRATAILLLIVALGFAAGPLESGSRWLVGKDGAGGNAAVSGLGSLAGDHRTGSRLTMMGDALRATEDSPLIGQGPGSAASGTKLQFRQDGKVHVRPHNGLLGVAVESGILGLALFLVLIGTAALALLRRLRSGSRPAAAGMATAAAFSLFSFFLVGDALGALPVSLCLALVTGVFLAADRAGTAPQSGTPDG